MGEHKTHHRLVLLMTRNARAAPGFLERAFADTVTGAEGIACGLAVGLPRDPLAGSAHRMAVAAAPVFDAAIWLASPVHTPDALAEWIAPTIAEAGAGLDRARSAAIGGMAFDIIRGASSGIYSVFALHRRASLSPARFRETWLGDHAELAETDRTDLSAATYRQLHADAAASRAAATRLGFGIAGFDGAAESVWPSADAMRAAFASEHVARTALDDERRFIDHPRSVLVALQTVAECPMEKQEA